jgi:hypothetical protein
LLPLLKHFGFVSLLNPTIPISIVSLLVDDVIETQNKKR